MSLETNPVATKAGTSLVGFCIGDILAQFLEAGSTGDVTRLARLAAYGLLLDGPVGHLWYKWLDGTVDRTFEDSKGPMAVGIKTAADQLIWAPVMTMVFFAFLKLLEGQPDLIWSTVADKTLPTVAANYVIWPAAHVISFKYVPSQQRILYNNSIAIFWNCYLSLAASGHHSEALSATPSPAWDSDTLLLELSELYSKLQAMLGIHSAQPASTTLASDLVQLYHNFQSAMGIHKPENANTFVSGAQHAYKDALSMLGMHASEPEGFARVFGAMSPSAHREDGLDVHSMAETIVKAQHAAQAGMHDSMSAGASWLMNLMQHAAHSTTQSHHATTIILDSLRHVATVMH